MESNKQKVFFDFPEISKDAWIEKIKSDLKNPGALERLVWKSEEGINVDPFYRSEDLGAMEHIENLRSRKKPATSPNGWISCQEVVPGNDPDLAGEQMMEALKGGAQAICIRFSGSQQYGLKELKAMLKHLPLAETEIFYKEGMRIDALYEDLCEVGRNHGVQPDHFKGGLGADPLGFMMRTGYPIASLENLGKLIKKVSKQSPFLKTLEVNGGLFQNAGATLVQELAFTMSIANEYLATLTDRGIDPAIIQESMRLIMASGPVFYMEIAKYRAARYLWSQVAEVYGIAPSDSKISIHATTASWNQTVYDPYVNMLRSTSQAIAAVIGGADYLTVLPFDHASGPGSSFSHRIARNVSIILREEAYLDKVADPAAGSYYFENLTHQIGERAWDLFKEVASRGGFRKAFESGWIQQNVSESGNHKKEKFINGKGRLIGTNAYPDQKEIHSKHPGEAKNQDTENATLDSLNPFRASALLEEIRMKVGNMEPRPRVYLLKYGHPNWVSARASFSANFFASGGYEILDPAEFGSIKNGADRALQSHAEIVVFCSSDEGYADITPEIVEILEKQSLLIIAGDPRPSREQLEKMGIQHYIHLKSPLMETLQMINSIVLK